MLIASRSGLHIPHTRLAGFYFAYFAMVGVFSPYFGPFLKSRGVADFEISVVLSCWFGARIVAPSPWSWLVAHSSKQVRMLQIGALAAALAFAPMLLQLSWLALLLAMFGFSFFYNAIMPQFEALTLSHLRAAPESYSRIRLWGSVGFMVSVLLAGWVCEHYGYESVPSMMLGCMLLVVGYSFANDYAPSPERATVTTEISHRHAATGTFLLLAFLMQVAHGPYYVYFSLLLERYGYSPTAAGLYWSIGVLAEVAMFLLAPALLRRYPLTWLMACCVGLGAVRWLLTGLYGEFWWLLVLLQMLHALTFGLFHACAMRALALLFPGPDAGHGQALLYGLGSGCGGVAGSLLAGVVWTKGSDRASFMVAGLVSLVALALIPSLQAALSGGKSRAVAG